MTEPTRHGPARRVGNASEALLLIGHGSARYPDAGRILENHAATLRAGGPFAEVAVAFLAGTPIPSVALASVARPVVHVVPFFMDEGYFTRVAVPDALAAKPPIPRRGAPSPRLITHPAIGSHPGFAALIVARVRAAGLDPASHALLLVGHGSARLPGRRMTAHDHADRLRAAGLFQAVAVAFLEEAPLIPDALAHLTPHPTIVLGLFANHGTHARDDMPPLLAAARDGRSEVLVDLGIVGDDAGMPSLILDLVRRTADA